MANLVLKDGKTYLAADLVPRKISNYRYDYDDDWDDHLADLFSDEEEAAFTNKLEVPEPEAEEVWRMRVVYHHFGGAGSSTVRPGKNSRRPWIGDHGGKNYLIFFDKAAVLAEVVVNERRFRVSRAA